MGKLYTRINGESPVGLGRVGSLKVCCTNSLKYRRLMAREWKHLKAYRRKISLSLLPPANVFKRELYDICARPIIR